MGETSTESSLRATLHTIGRYVLSDVIAAGGMAKVYLGRLLGPAGFSRTVAIKRLHPHLAVDEEFVRMFLDEARLAARIRHPHVVPTLDIARSGDELLLVMEYIHGESLAGLVQANTRTGARVSVPIAAAVMIGVLNGLHAAHETTDERGQPLHVVHRDVSPQNVLVGTDGIARVADFGVAKAHGRSHSTGDRGHLKGKLAYMPPEQFRGDPPTPQIDVYAAAVVLWELLTGRRRFRHESEATTINDILYGNYVSVRSIARDVPPALDRVIEIGMLPDPRDRYATAHEMAVAIENCVRPASSAQVGSWVSEVAREALAVRDAMLAGMGSERSSGTHERGEPPDGRSPGFAGAWSKPDEASAIIESTRAARLARSDDAGADEPAPETSAADLEHSHAGQPSARSHRAGAAWAIGGAALLVVCGGALTATFARPHVLDRTLPRAAVVDPTPRSTASTGSPAAPTAVSPVPAAASAPPPPLAESIAATDLAPSASARPISAASAKPTSHRSTPVAPRLPRGLPGERN
jgi:serine/threonine-protein kinase